MYARSRLETLWVCNKNQATRIIVEEGLTSKEGGPQAGYEGWRIVNDVSHIAIFYVGASFFLENLEPDRLYDDVWLRKYYYYQA